MPHEADDDPMLTATSEPKSRAASIGCMKSDTAPGSNRRKSVHFAWVWPNPPWIKAMIIAFIHEYSSVHKLYWKDFVNKACTIYAFDK